MIIKIEITKLVNCMIVKFYFSVGIARKVVFVGGGGLKCFRVEISNIKN